MSGIRWTEQEYEAWAARYNRPAVRPANMESAVADASQGPNQANEVHPRVCIKVHSRRRRLADPDGVSAKAVVDGLRQGGLLVDDSLKYVESVAFTQEKAAVEETVITVEVL